MYRQYGGCAQNALGEIDNGAVCTCKAYWQLWEDAEKPVSNGPLL